ncbi:hypothetical protein [Pinisolibacter sp.]|uniref:hypothetical protein n=1 Tax=Pinisolibacter sp. TaxID=2172024 RepID=UPI002FDD70C4
MDFMYVLLVVEVFFLVAMGLVLWKVLAAMKRRAGGSSTGWSALEAAWGVTEAPKDPITTRANLMVGKVLWRNCVVVGIDPRGLHLAVKVPIFGGFGKTPVRIPWTAFHDPEPARLFWADATMWRLGTPEVATITLPGDLESRLDIAGHALGGRKPGL